MSWARVQQDIELYPYTGAASLAPRRKKVRAIAKMAAIRDERSIFRSAMKGMDSASLYEVTATMDGVRGVSDSMDTSLGALGIL